VPLRIRRIQINVSIAGPAIEAGMYQFREPSDRDIQSISAELVLSKNSIRAWGARRDPLSICSCRVSIVIIEHSAESLTLSHGSRLFGDSIYWNDEPVAKPLMISLEVIMCNELPNRSPQSVLTEEDHLFQTTFLDRADKSFRKWIQIRRSRRQFDGLDTGVFKDA
jgi:hypothetical protein